MEIIPVFVELFQCEGGGNRHHPHAVTSDLTAAVVVYNSASDPVESKSRYYGATYGQTWMFLFHSPFL